MPQGQRMFVASTRHSGHAGHIGRAGTRTGRECGPVVIERDVRLA